MTDKDRVNILVLDDEKDFSEALCSFIEFQGWEAHQESHADLALRFIQSNKVDIVISDISMPDFSGIDFAVQLKKVMGENAPPVILITGYSSFEEKKLLRNGIVGLLSKPFNPDKLVKLISKLI